MKKIRYIRFFATFVSIVLFISCLPIMAQAATSVVLNAPDIISKEAGVGFYDNPAGGGNTRGLELDGAGRVCLRTTEWLKYEVKNLTPGVYRLSMNSSSTSQVKVSFDLGDTNIVSKQAVNPSGSYSIFKDNFIADVTIKEDGILTITNESSGSMYLKSISLYDLETVKKKEAFYEKNSPYKMSYVPCIIEAENFDFGKAGTAYQDSDSGNIGNAYRMETDVDIYKDDDNSYYVNLSLNDWTKYTFTAIRSGNYDLILNCIDPAEESKVRVFIDGYEVVRTISKQIMPIGKKRETNLGSFKLSAGVHNIVVMCLDGDFNLDYIRFAKSKNEGMDLSDTSSLRKWEDALTLADEDYVEEEVINPIEKELYVVSGSKNGNGTEENPFGTIEEARDHVKTLNDDMKGDIIVNLSGDFRLSETLLFTEEDSGTNGFNVVYRGNENTTVHGGRKVTGWKQVENSPLWQTELKDVEDFRQLYIGENRGVRSKSKWLYWMAGEYDDPDTNYTNAEGYYINASDFPQGFSRPEQMEMIWMPSWINIRIPVKSIEPAADGKYLVKYPQPYFDAVHNSSAPITLRIPYYFENAPEFLDEPGEYYFNKDTKILTYYPTADEDMNTIDCYIPELEQLVAISGTSIDSKVTNITLEGISFRYSAWEATTRKGFSTIQADCLIDADAKSDGFGDNKGYGCVLIPAAIEIDYANNINIKNSEIAHNGAVGVAINHASTKCNVLGNLFDDNSATAITIGDWKLAKSDPIEKYTRKIKIANNLIRRTSAEYMTPAITGYHVNSVTIDHNDILDAPYTGISMGWGWGRNYENVAYNKITNNRIENVLFKLADGGHIYTLDAMKGSIIKGNYMKKTGEWKGGIYHDNASSYITSTENVFEDCPKWLKITWHNIHDNVAYNNYSERPFVCTYPDSNNISPAIGKTNGEWPQEAKDIINNAGVSEDYKYLLEDYEAKGETRNEILTKQPFSKYPGTLYEAGRYMEGGEGVAYHDILGNDAGRSMMGEPSVYERYDGTYLLYVMVTQQGEWVKYKFNIEEAGEYEIKPILAVVNPSTAITVDVDDKRLADKQVLKPNCTGYDEFTPYDVGTVYLEPGEHTVRFEHTIANYGMEGFIVNKKGNTELIRNDGFVQDYIDVCLSK